MNEKEFEEFDEHGKKVAAVKGWCGRESDDAAQEIQGFKNKGKLGD